MNKEESNEKLWAKLMEKRDAQLSEFQGTLDGKRKLNQTVRKMIRLKPKLSGDIGPFNRDARDQTSKPTWKNLLMKLEKLFPIA